MNRFIIASLIPVLLVTSCSRQEPVSHEENIPLEETSISIVISEAENTAAAVTETSGSSETTPSEQASGITESNVPESNILVVYFSRTGEQYTVGVIDKGNTAIVAEMIAEETGADMFEIMPADDHYPMTYDELTEVALTEQSENARPEYAGEVPDLAQYDTIFIGAPVWWSDWPMIMYTFFEDNSDALSGKNLIPFSTHEGSGLSGFDKKLASAIPGSTVLKGLAVRGNDCQNKQEDVRNSVDEWVSELGY